MNEILPKWTFDDVYIDFENDKFIQSLKDADEIINKIYKGINEMESITTMIDLYELAFDKLSSLKAFCRCKLSENTKDDRVAINEDKISKSLAMLDEIRQILFNKMDALSINDKIWHSPQLERWKFLYDEYKNSWKKSLNDQNLNELKQSNFIPLYSIFTHLNNLISIKAEDKNSDLNTYNLSKCSGILKGSPDAILRKNISDGLNSHYEKFSPIYIDVLNMLQGFRLNEFKVANIDPFTPSFQQNRISSEAINAMYKALFDNVNNIRQAVSLRAKFLNKDRLSSYDLLAPSPFSSKELIPYKTAIFTIKSALNTLSPQIGNFIDMMIKNRWIEAQNRNDKAGGAFYTRFNEFKQPRVFTSYMGTQAHMIQQAHELGHAWHYWIMRDMPTIKTEFPMSLAEIASTFNEAVLRDYLQQNSYDDTLFFDILWQELKSAANFMLHIMVRYDFEISFIKFRSEKILTSAKVQELLANAWRKWYGDTTDDIELFLPYFKLHFYKTDQYIYNYPYAVGYLISQFLINKFREDGDKFIDIYKPFLRDCGCMSVDDIILKHFKKDIKSTDFWSECINSAMIYIDKFKSIQNSIKFKN
ncbi:peptidase M3 [Campylobacter sp. faydin G-140]|uniref:M3 family metallopeptidase n=1 Tax=Campylobacter anatolicus TaxID=2829105 RepID=UPI001B923D33|nr:M3 family metallopeptidase [Campylobacter anatolicus]MBR8465154.1 peptidase M3 [Campylobacter anatolicus]